MTRAAIYARFSDVLQRDRSIEDQIALCREIAARDNMTVVATFDDRALSGSSIANRRGRR
jgi:site-specific DNA recombinase